MRLEIQVRRFETSHVELPMGNPTMKKVSFARICKLASGLADVEESTSFGTPALKVGGKLFACMHQDGESLVVRIEEPDRTMRMVADPTVFYITGHYVEYPWMLVRLARAHDSDLKELLTEAWQLVARHRGTGTREKSG